MTHAAVRVIHRFGWSPESLQEILETIRELNLKGRESFGALRFRNVPYRERWITVVTDYQRVFVVTVYERKE